MAPNDEPGGSPSTSDHIGYLRLAEAREKAGNSAGAVSVLQTAVEAGSGQALVQLAELYEKAGDDESALPLLRRAAEAGHGDALLRLALLCVRTDHDEAEELAGQVADAGIPEVLSSLADRREEAGDRDAGERIRWRLVAQGYAEALIALANRQAREGNREEAGPALGARCRLRGRDDRLLVGAGLGARSGAGRFAIGAMDLGRGRAQ
ncbi:tetratricopeptide repeat protein [Streptomyces sp. NPDC058291]|uniref:tetratricopeptide repeat protein n=1 Tax=Streptomyces sp. NPDC058291 TaxID=3346427 RepID=UPI0036EC0266